VFFQHATTKIHTIFKEANDASGGTTASSFNKTNDATKKFNFYRFSTQPTQPVYSTNNKPSTYSPTIVYATYHNGKPWSNVW
jgi:hypothetical protein